MKLAKRILVAVLAIALLASVFAFSSVAEVEREYDYSIESFTKAEQILEYYALDAYLADNYENGTWDEATFTTKRNAVYSVTADPLNAENKVLEGSLKRRDELGYSLKSSGSDLLTDKLIVSMRVYFDQTATTGLDFNLNVGLKNEIEADARYYDIFNLDMLKGTFTYSGWNAESQEMLPNANTYEGWTVETGVWYDFLIVFNAEDDVYSAVVKSVPTDDSEPEILASTGNVSIDGATGMAGFTLSVSKGAGNGSSVFYFDNVEIYEGTTTRSPSYKEENTKIHIADLINFYKEETTDFATKVRIANVFYELSKVYNVEFEDETAYAQMYETLARELVNLVEKIDSEATFADRLAYVESIDKYNEKLTDNENLITLPGITEDLAAAVVAARDVFYVEKDQVDLVKEHSENFIDFMTNVYDDENTDYLQMKVWIAELKDEYVETNPEFAAYDTEKYPYQTRFYSSADYRYKNIPELLEDYNAFLAKFSEIEEHVEAFIYSVDSIEGATSFGPKYTSYVKATEQYNEGVIHEALNNSTHAELAERIAYYLQEQITILAKKEQCDTFIDLVKQASVASYYTILVEKIDLAVAAYEFIEPDYEDIADYITSYNALIDRREGIEAEAAAYIAAVEAIAQAEGFYAKKDAVLNAAEFKVKGDVLGYAGIEEANIAFSEAEADVNFRENSSMSLINLVAEINATESIAARRKLLRLAETANANADDEIKGVDIAKAAFEAAVAEFKADVAAANATITAATDAAAAIAGAVKGASIFN